MTTRPPDEVLAALERALGASYAIERELGGGGMSRVFLATDATLGRRVVLKVLPPDLSSGVSVERFRREIQLAAQLQHPHIVPLLTAGDADGLLYYTMPFVEGESLRARLTREGELPLGTAARILREVLRSLAYAHRKGVVHRDIKPENILLGEDGVMVADFGVAKALTASSGGRSSLTSLGVALGTPAYMAPEQAAADPHVDHRADIYAVGAVGYELLTGNPPFTGRTPQQMLAAHVTEKPEPITARRPSVPAPLAALIMSCLEKRPADRPQSADDVLQHLDTIVSSGAMAPTSAVMSPIGTPPVASARRRWRTGMIGGAVAGAGLVAVTVILAAKARQPALDANRVVVATFDNRTGDAALQPLGIQAAEYISQGIASLQFVEVVDRDAAARAEESVRGEGSRPEARFAALARETRASTVVGGSVYRVGDSVQIQAHLSDARTGRIIRALEPVRAPVRDALRALEPVRQRLMGGVAILHDSTLGPWLMPARQPPPYALLQALAAADRIGDPAEYTRAVARAEALDPVAASPALTLADWLIDDGFRTGDDALLERADSVLRGLESRADQLTLYEQATLTLRRARLTGDWGAALRGRREMARLAPVHGSYRLLAVVLLSVNRPREAIETFRRADELPGPRQWLNYGINFTRAYHYVGEHDRELELARRVRREAPERLGVFLFELRALAALGQNDALAEKIDEMLDLPAEPGSYTKGSVLTEIARELVAHGHRAAATTVLDQEAAWYRTRPAAEVRARGVRDAHLLAVYSAGRWDEARHLADSLAREHPRSIDYAGWRARIAARRGDRATAERLADSLGALDRPYLLGRHTYQRAMIAALLGRSEDAVILLRDAFAQGRTFNERFELHLNPDFDSLRPLRSFRALTQPQG